MAHALFNLRSEVFNTPQLMSLNEFEGIVEYLNDRCSGKIGVDELSAPVAERSDSVDGKEYGAGRFSYNQDVQAAVINLEGPTTYKPTTWAALCGGFDYQTLKEDFLYLAEQGAKVVAFHMDSPGGHAHQMIDSANYIRKVADEYDITVLTYVDGTAASAGYGIACISDRVYMSSDSEVGSIGVVVRLINDNEKLKKDGIQRTYLTAGKSKVPFDSDGEFDQSFLDDMQFKINTLYDKFTEHVASHRNMSVELVRSTEAKTFLPSDAIELGLADGEMTVEEFYSHLADVAQQRKGSEENMFHKNKLFLKKEDEIEMTQLAQMQEKITTLEASLEEAQKSVVELASVKEQLEAMQSKLAETEAALVEANAVAEAAAQEKENMKLEARKEKLASVLPTDKAETLATTLAELSDEAFEVVLSGYSTAKVQMEESDLFTEVGANAGEPVQQETVDHTARLLAERFGN